MEKHIVPTKNKTKSNLNLINTEFISKYNNWSLDYTFQVQFEYERFLLLRNMDENLSPSDSIDMFWHTHILDTKSYYNYCMNKYGKIIHHNPEDSFNQELRKIRFGSTLVKYKEKFGSPVYFEIWNYSKKSNSEIIKPNSEIIKPNSEIIKPDIVINNIISELDLNTRPQLELPNYKEHLISEPNIIKIFIFHTFVDGYSIPKDLENIANYKWRPNDIPIDRKVISVKVYQTSTIDDIKKFISNKIKHNKFALNIFPHPTWKKILDAKSKVESNSNNNLINNFNSNGIQTFASNYLEIVPDPSTKNIILKPGDNTFKFYIAELFEMTEFSRFC